MARRASSQPQFLTLLLLVLLLGAGLGGGYWLYLKFSDPYRTLTPLDVASYLDNADSLSGNVYKVEGTVANSLHWSPVQGRLFAVEIGESGNDVVAILIPATFNHINIQKGQRYNFKVEVGKNGILLVQDLSKV